MQAAEEAGLAPAPVRRDVIEEEAPPDFMDLGGCEFSVLRKSSSLGSLFKALSLAQGEMTDPPKTKTAKVPMKTGGSYSYKYSDLADVLKIIRPVFKKHGLCLIQFPVNPTRGAVTVITIIGHESGQFIQGSLTLSVGDEKPQTLGGAVTYGRRYSAGGAAGISPDDDDDGHSAQVAAPENKVKRTVTSHDSAQAGPVYDPENYKHSDQLTKTLRGRQIPEGRFLEISEALKGRPTTDLDLVLKDLQG